MHNRHTVILELKSTPQAAKWTRTPLHLNLILLILLSQRQSAGGNMSSHKKNDIVYEYTERGNAREQQLKHERKKGARKHTRCYPFFPIAKCCLCSCCLICDCWLWLLMKCDMCVNPRMRTTVAFAMSSLSIQSSWSTWTPHPSINIQQAASDPAADRIQSVGHMFDRDSCVNLHYVFNGCSFEIELCLFFFILLWVLCSSDSGATTSVNIKFVINGRDYKFVIVKTYKKRIASNIGHHFFDPVLCL